jgi:nitrogen-specific signal transduction histidine kinase
VKNKTITSRLTAYNNVHREIVKCRSSEEAISLALDQIRKKLNVQVASLFLFSKNGNLKRVGINGIDRNQKEIENTWLPHEEYDPGESFTGKPVPEVGLNTAGILYGEPQYSNDIKNDYPELKYSREYAQKLGALECGISVPINGIHRTVGTLEVLNKLDASGFTDNDLYILMLISSTLGNLLSNFTSLRRLEQINQITEEIISIEADDSEKSEERNLKDTLKLITDNMISSSSPYKVCIVRLLSNADELEEAQISYTPDIFIDGRDNSPIHPGRGVASKVAKQNRAVFIKDVNSSSHQYVNEIWLKKNHLTSHACLPLSIEGNIHGTLSVYAAYPHEHSSTNISFLKTIAWLTAAIIYAFKSGERKRNAQIKLDRNKRRFFNQVYTQGHDMLMKTIFHQYKNELIDLSSNLRSSLKENRLSESRGIIQEQIKWIDRRTDEVQIELLKVSYEPTAVDLNNLIIKTAAFFNFSSSNIKVDLNLDEHIPIIEIEELAITQVVYNLIGNSVDAIDEVRNRRGKLSISTAIIEIEMRSFIQLSISDNGAGIQNEIKDKIMEKGYSTRKNKGGTGMGLFLSREILESLGGSIHFDSDSKKGTTFFARIPLEWYRI